MKNYIKNSLKCCDCGGKISIWKKSLLCNRNRYSIRCKNCGTLNRLPTWSNLNYIINFSVLIVIIGVLKPRKIGIFILILISSLISNIVTVFFMPLTLTEKTKE